jgi:hypothetical protein
MKRASQMLMVGLMLLCSAAAEADGLDPVGALPLLGTRAHDIAIQGDCGSPEPSGCLAYVATDDGLTIVDVSNRAAPSVLSSLDLGGETMGVAVKGSYAFLANTNTDFNVVDVSNPNAPVLVASKGTSGKAYDVAVKDDIAYVTSFGGELYLFRISNSGSAKQIAVLGILAWTNAGSDAANLAKLSKPVSSGGGKATGVSVTGNTMIVTEANYGRVFHYDVTTADQPIFRGTHYAPFTFRGEANADETVAYAISTYGNSSGIYSFPTQGPTPYSTRHKDCSGCGYFRIPATDYGGIAVSPNGKYVVYIAGKKGNVEVVNAADPSAMTSADSVSIPGHGTKTLESMGVAISGDYIYTAAGTLGVQVFSFRGLSD